MAAMTKSDHHATYEVLVENSNVASVGAAAVGLHTLTVAGIDPATDTCVAVESQQALETGLALGGCRVSAADTVVVAVINPTAAPIDAAATHDFKVVLARK